MGGERDRARVGHAKALRGLAKKHGLARVPTNAARVRVEEMAASIVQVPDLPGEDRAAAQAALALPAPFRSGSRTHRHYFPEGAWLRGLWNQHKISHKAYQEPSV